MIRLLQTAYETLSPRQRRDVFGALLDDLRSGMHGGDWLLKEIEAFRERSLRGDYFNDSGKFADMPAETTEWFDRLGDLLTAAVSLTSKGDNFVAVEAFAALFELIDIMETCDHDIIFAEEFGTWLIPIHMHEVAEAYVKALAATENDAAFTKAVVELIARDKVEGYMLKVYAAAKKHASAAQMVVLDAAIAAQHLFIQR